jgi:protein-tyrosine phosphatase
MSADDRWVELEGIENVRDVGGLPFRDGGTTRLGVLLRSASLEYVTPADVAHLVDVFGLTLILDLRTPREITRDGPTALASAGVETVELNLIGDSRNWLPETGEDTDPLVRNYLGYLEDHPENIVHAVRRLAAQDAGPALVHCAAGKDRTGTVVALVLDAIGVERDAVVADYALSAERVEALFRRWTAAAGEPMPADLSAHMPRAEAMAAVLAHLDEAHGGTAAWLTANGLTEAELAHLKARFTA